MFKLWCEQGISYNCHCLVYKTRFRPTEIKSEYQFTSLSERAHRKMPSFLIGFFSIPMGSVLNGKTPIPEEIGKLHVQLFYSFIGNY